MKPCPFCGGAATTSHGVDRIAKEYFFVSCQTCFGRTMNFYKWLHGDVYEQQAIEAWNKRTDVIASNPMSNADRLRAMNDRELADALTKLPLCLERGECERKGIKCNECLYEWLTEPADEP